MTDGKEEIKFEDGANKHFTTDKHGLKQESVISLQGVGIASISFIFNSQFLIAFLRDIPW